MLSTTCATSGLTTCNNDEAKECHERFDWEALKNLAGEPGPRLFVENERLFGAAAPLVHLWHDSAAWHPFANQIMILLEEMQLPHARSKVPLPQYQKPSDQNTYKKLGISDVPIVQCISNSGRHGNQKSVQGWQVSPPFKERSAVDICRKLNHLFPDHALMPRTPRRRAYAEAFLDHYSELQEAVYAVNRPSAAAHAFYIAKMDEFNGAWSGDISAPMSLARWGDDGDGSVDIFGGPVQDGPFLFGERPCAADVILLPLLERCEARPPHPLIGKAPHLAIGRWPALAGLQIAARVPGRCAYSELGTDEKTTLGIYFVLFGISVRLPAVDGLDLPHISDAAAAAGETARRDAASRLTANHAAVARFSCGGAGAGRPRQSCPEAPPARVVAAADEALRAVATTLLVHLRANSSELLTIAMQFAKELLAVHSASSLRKAAEAMVFLAENTGVPRDMTIASAHAFRSHLLLHAGSLGAACGGPSPQNANQGKGSI